jgi:hypothetical protein
MINKRDLIMSYWHSWLDDNFVLCVPHAFFPFVQIGKDKIIAEKEGNLGKVIIKK